jgi:hypothetical protein
MGPARSTIVRNVLIPDVSQVVGSVDVVPQHLVRERHILERALHY